MYSPEEAAALEKRNYRSIREMIRLSYTVGFNLMRPRRWDGALRIWTVVLSLSSLLSLYGHWQMFRHYLEDMPRIVETVSTALQVLTSVFKMWYFLFAHRRIYELLRQARCHELLQRCELFATIADLPVAQVLRRRVAAIMQRYWGSTRRQLLIYLYSVIALTSNYFFNSFARNLYRYVTQPPGSFEIVLPLPALYPGWEDKGLAFPYYHIQMYIESCALYICGMCAVSFDGVFIVVCLHGVGLMESLSEMIAGATSPLVPPERRVEYLRGCIYQYQRVASFAEEINDCFRHLTLSQFLLSLFGWGLALFQMSVGLGTSSGITMIRMTMYLTASGYQIVVYCYNGQRFATASEQIAGAFYGCEWYAECREFRQLIRMMLMRTNRCFRLDVSWFLAMSLPTLMSMVRTSGQYFLLLQNVSEK
ncbi:odorant receptor 63a [Drosophila miranda]|uniref:odorant receptor 63a n=1 Tax=Drosophila miranda TaxID=7229 RepID=UPI0007E833E6|nr:odorant receptor 63a [Drosophila miranda]